MGVWVITHVVPSCSCHLSDLTASEVCSHVAGISHPRGLVQSGFFKIDGPSSQDASPRALESLV